jgi:endonuclease-3
MLTGMRARRGPVVVRELVERLESVHGRPRYLPRFDPMDELVSCILSQHSADANSFPAFTHLRETYPEWEDVVAVGPERLAEVIRGAGLANQKAKNILGCLREINARTGGYTLDVLRDMPTLEARDWLRSLPGVGPKTASIVLCFALGRETIPVDTHVYRVSWRLGIIPEDLGEVKAHEVLMEEVPPDMAFRYHVTLIQHGRVTCRAPLPLCEQCNVTDACPWFQSGGPAARKQELSQARRKGAA